MENLRLRFAGDIIKPRLEEAIQGLLMDQTVNEIRTEIAAAFSDVPIPSVDEVYDKTDGRDTEYYRDGLAGKHWSEVTNGKVYGIFGGTLSDPAFRYYIQTCLLSEVVGVALGADPSDVYLVGAEEVPLDEEPDRSDPNQPWLPYYPHDYLESVFDAKQLDAIATYIWFHAYIGSFLAQIAFDRFWKRYVMPDGIIHRLGWST